MHDVITVKHSADTSIQRTPRMLSGNLAWAPLTAAAWCARPVKPSSARSTGKQLVIIQRIAAPRPEPVGIAGLDERRRSVTCGRHGCVEYSCRCTQPLHAKRLE